MHTSGTVSKAPPEDRKFNTMFRLDFISTLTGVSANSPSSPGSGE